MNIQEKDCRRCEKFDEKGHCTARLGGNKVEMPRIPCFDFTPIPGRDCRNCQRFNGYGNECLDKEGESRRAANHLTHACIHFNPVSQTTKPSPTILTYQDLKIIRGDKTLSLENIQKSTPCEDEFRNMAIVFMGVGFNFDSEIFFTQENLSLLSNSAFNWLLGQDFFLNAPKDEPTYKVGQWFKGVSKALYLLCETHNPSRIMLLLIGGKYDKAKQCSPGIWNTIEGANESIGHTCWQELKPIDSPLG